MLVKCQTICWKVIANSKEIQDDINCQYVKYFQIISQIPKD